MRIDPALLSIRLVWVALVLASVGLAEETAGGAARSYPDLMQQDNAYLKCYAIHNIALKHPEQMNLVPASLSDTNPHVRTAAYFAMGLNPKPEYVKLFQDGLSDRDPGVRRYALVGLANVENAKYIDLAAESYRDPHPWVRETLAAAVGQYRCQPLLGHVVKLLEDPSHSVRRAAAAAIGSIGDQRALKYLQRAMQQLGQQTTPQKNERLNSHTQSVLQAQKNFPLGFCYFPEIIDKFAQRSGVQVLLFEELAYLININAENPENLNNLKVSMWGIQGDKALDQILQTVSGYRYMDFGMVYVAPEAYRYADTPLELELAYALARLGDRSETGIIKSYLRHDVYGPKAKMMWKNIR